MKGNHTFFRSTACPKIIYRAFGFRQYQCLRTTTGNGIVTLHLLQQPKHDRCSQCQSTNVIRHGAEERTIRTVPIGGKPVDLLLPVPRLGCHDCGLVRQAAIGFARPFRRFTHAFERYALGLLAFVSLTGRMPFSGETLEAEMHSRLIDAPTSLSQVASQVAWPSALQQLFDRTFDRDVEQRPAGALAFARELYDIVTQWTGATAPPGLIAPSAMATVPNPSAAPLSSATQALSTASSGVAPHADASWRAAKSRADATEARANGGGRLALYVTLGTVVVAIAAGAYQWSARSSGAPSGLAGGGDSASSTVTTAPAASPASPASVAPGSNAADSSAMATRGAPPATPSGTSAPSATAKPPGAGSAGASSNAGSNAGSSAGSNAGSSAGSSANAKSAHDELRALMNRFDRDGSATVARDVVSTLETLRPRLEASLDQAWADFYLGMSLATLGDNAKACTALERAQSLGENSVVRTESLEWRVRLRCQPDGQQ